MKNKVFLKISLFLIIFGTVLFLPFIGEKEFQGEEGRRVLLALQMLETKEFLFPKLFGEPYFLKPSGYNWFLALWFFLTKDFSEFTARASSAFIIILTSLVLTWFWIKILRKEGFDKEGPALSLLPFLPGLIFLTIPEVIDKGLRAEIDGFYTFLVTTGIFSWFYFYELTKRRCLGFLLWGIFMGFSVLTKTFHALLFFYLAWIPYLFYFKKLKELFTFPHFLGIGITLGIFGIWFFFSLGFDLNLFSAWLGEYKDALSGAEVSLGEHFEFFTLGFLTGYAPWIFVLFLFKDPGFIQVFLKKHPNFFKLIIFSLFLFMFSYMFHFFSLGARLRYMLPAIGGLVFISAIGFLYLIVYKKEILNRSLRIFVKLLPWILAALGVMFLGYLILRKFYYWEALVVVWVLIIGSLAFGFRFWKKVSYQGFLWFLVFCVFSVKQVYAAFYYSYHKEKVDYFRKASQNLVLAVGKGEVIYLCEEAPHHLIYYGKYKYKTLDFKYLKPCDKRLIFELKDRWVLLSKKRFESLGLNEKDFKIFQILPVRKKVYLLVKP
ncbi:hypothetical protein F1847_02090 [Thermodesulfobacterium sp. TA1]|uniref:ArnT family glycosyltransferase n=1 Tax=Thermodesulfobacterium sp. TA1 TaxID=2234087 RepID=UPI001232E003|nr:hypothetical protein [Thermodesulfobacterium sp. TA1]QER41590.1 hypothetical protein F1847_02090 [Thermodesulfobacterium sp. TA1]